MNKEKAIATFLERVERLSRLPFITDSETDELFGEEVADALAEFERYNQKEQVCSHCESRCCPAIDCEFYAPQFTRCPIYDLRPPVCRLHFCHRFPLDNGLLMKELGDIFLESLLVADRHGSLKIRLFDCPPISRIVPALVAITAPLMDAIRNGTLTTEYAERLIRQQVEQCRISVPITPYPFVSLSTGNEDI
jgi:hypothetical protein